MKRFISARYLVFLCLCLGFFSQTVWETSAGPEIPNNPSAEWSPANSTTTGLDGDNSAGGVQPISIPLPENADDLSDFAPPKAHTEAATAATAFANVEDGGLPIAIEQDNAFLFDDTLAVVFEANSFNTSADLSTHIEPYTPTLTTTHPLSEALGTEFLYKFQLDVTDSAGQPLPFSKEARLVVDARPWQSNLPDAYQTFFLAYWDENLEAWASVPTMEINGFLVADVAHFSSWAVGTNPEKWTPVWTPPTVSTFSGAATYNYPIEVPPGRNGLQPSVGLSYSSRALDGHIQTMGEGVVPDGWSLGGDIEILRSGVKAWQPNNTPRMDYPDRYRLILNGAGYELTTAQSTLSDIVVFSVVDNPTVRVIRYYKSTINADGFYWIVQTGDGTQYRLGYTTDSEEWHVVTGNGSMPAFTYGHQGNGGAGVTAVAWHVDTVTDLFGNQMEYNYAQTSWSETIYGETWQTDLYLTPHTSRLTEINYNYSQGYSGALPVPPTVARPSTLSGNSFASQVQFIDGADSDKMIDQIAVYHRSGSSLVKVREYILASQSLLKYNDGYYPPTVNPPVPEHFDDGSCHNIEVGQELGNSTRTMTSITERVTTAGGTTYALPPVKFDYFPYRHFLEGNQFGCFYFFYLSEYSNGYNGWVKFIYSSDNWQRGGFDYLAELGRNQWPDIGHSYYVTQVRMDSNDEKLDNLGPYVASDDVVVDYAYSGPCYGQTRLEPDIPAEVPRCGGADAPEYGTIVGFANVTQTSKDFGGSTTLNIQKFTFSQNMAKAFGQILKVELYKADNTTLLSCNISTYVDDNALIDRQDSIQFYNGGSCPSFDSPTGTRIQTTQDFTYNAYGSPTTVHDYGHLVLLGDETTTVTDYGQNITTPTYNSGVAVAGYWLLNQPQTIKKYSDATATTQQQETRLYYDGNSSYTAAPTKGKVTKTEVGLPGATLGGSTAGMIVTGQMTYDTYGNLLTNITPGGATTTLTYESTYHLYPTQSVQSGTGVETQTTLFEVYGFNGVATDDFQVQPGLLKKITNPNNTYTFYEYDPFGRLFATYDNTAERGTGMDPWDGNPLMRYRYWDNTWNSTLISLSNGGNFAITEQPRPGDYPDPPTTLTYSLNNIAYFDGFGRVVQARERYKSVGTTVQDVITVTDYTAQGQTRCVSAPFAVATTAGFSTAVCGASGTPGTITNYDVLGRPTTTVGVSGQTVSTMSYAIMNLTDPSIYYQVATAIDANGHASTQITNPQGKLMEVWEYSGENPNFAVYARTKYSYDWQSNLTQVVNKAGTANAITTSMTYDVLGRKTGMADPDMGSWVYDYDASSQMVSQTDAKGVKICFTYDAYGRVTYKKQFNALYQNCTDTLARYTYNGGGTGSALGQLSEIRWPNVNNRDVFTYNADGLMASQTRTINGRNYTMSIGYDTLNRPSQVTYPNNEVVTTTYDREGANGLTTVYPGLSSVTLLNGLLYNERGQLTQIDRPNSNQDTLFTYYGATGSNGNNSYRLQTLQAGSGSYIHLNFGYGYDAVGNITQITDYKLGSDAQTFAYDYLNRLTVADGTGGGGMAAYHHVYEYDELGNITSVTKGSTNPVMTTYDYSGTAVRPHAVTTMSGGTTATMLYDNNGNMSSRTMGVTYVQNFDGENRLTSVSISGVSGSTTIFAYDDKGQRTSTAKPSGGGTTYFPFSGYEEEITSTQTTQRLTYVVGGQAVALRVKTVGAVNSNTIYYLHNDHLGSASVVSESDSTPVAVSNGRYLPYGEYRLTPNSSYTSQGFTGHLHNDSLGLIYMNARFYVPSIGRFASADTIVPDPSNPQTWNRYSYVYNRPLTYADPSGHSGNSNGGVIYDGDSNELEDYSYLQIYESALAGGMTMEEITYAYEHPVEMFEMYESAHGPIMEVATQEGITGESIETLNILSDSPQSSYQGNLLNERLELEELYSNLNPDHTLTTEAINAADEIISGVKLNNPAVINELTADGSSINDWSKYTTQTIHSPIGDFQAHFYYNSVTGEVNYNIDYKFIFNGVPR